jgi:outer membrane protein assembly factor BamD (BamD/ComL family)
VKIIVYREVIMVANRFRFIVLAAVIILSVLPNAWAEGRFDPAVAQIKNLIYQGETEAVHEAYQQLEKDFPEIAGPQLDAFSKAEILLSQGKLSKAFRAYDAFVSNYPQSKLYDTAIDRQFSIGRDYLAGEKKTVLLLFKVKGYAEGVRIMDKLSDRLGNSQLALEASLAVAENYEKRGEFDDAYHQWSQIQSRWPTGDAGRDALLGMARCKLANYRGPRYDASTLVSAKSYYGNFKLRYPNAAEKIGVDKILGGINEQLAQKALVTADYYARTGNKQSAYLCYQLVLDDWPGTEAAERAVQKLETQK